MKTCPECAEEVQDAASTCRYCGAEQPSARILQLAREHYAEFGWHCAACGRTEQPHMESGACATCGTVPAEDVYASRMKESIRYVSVEESIRANERQMEAADRVMTSLPPLPPRRWEANPAGLSGRVIRGYRHWRHKR